MVILYPDKVAVGDIVRQRVGENRIDILIGLPVRLTYIYLIDLVMEQRPQNLI